MTNAAVITLATIEGHHLARIVADFIDLVSARASEDPAIDRLAPDAYPDDTAASAEFTDLTRSDLLDRRVHEAQAVLDALATFATEPPLSDDDARIPQDVHIGAADIDAWLRTLTAIRLVIATRLGITTDDEAERGDGHDVYEWLGYRLELLIEAADQLDEQSPS